MPSRQITPADRFQLLTSATTAAFSAPAAHTATVATPTEAGRLLLEENLAAVRRRTSGGRGRLPLDLQQRHYQDRPVDRLHPIEVIKAGTPTSSWPGTASAGPAAPPTG